VKLVVGLGNPGGKYVGTPHNVGFAVADELAARWSERFRRSLRFSAKIAKASLNGESVWVAKPQTYMNLSGQAVGAILRYNKLARSDLIVVFDDADLTLGRIRIRPKGGAGGHRGLESVITHVGGADFARVRLGIGRREQTGNLVAHVLKPFSGAQQREFGDTITRAADAVEEILGRGVDRAMNRFNVQSEREKQDRSSSSAGD